MRVLEGENGLSLVCAPSLQAEGAAGGHRSGREGSGAPARASCGRRVKARTEEAEAVVAVPARRGPEEG